MQNDGAASDSYLLRGPGSSTGFTVRYFAGTTNITTAVVNGSYRLADLAPGAARSIQLRVTVGSGAARGSARTGLVTATSVGSGTSVDAVRSGPLFRAGMRPQRALPRFDGPGERAG